MKTLVLLVALSALVLTGCSSTDVKIHNDNEFIFSREGEAVVVTLVVHKTDSDLRTAIPNPTEGVRGQTIYSPNDNKCTVHISTESAPKLSNSYFKLLGHEISHCYYGSFHN